MTELEQIASLEQCIYIIRGQKTILDRHLARLYGVGTGELNRAVRRNLQRFPPDFMWRLTKTEWTNLKCQNGIPSWGGDRALPCAFTELGVAMLSSVLRSERAIQANIAIMRVFQRLRRLLAEDSGLAGQVVEHERRITHCEGNIKTLIAVIPRLPGPAPAPRPVLGFTPPPKITRRAKKRRP